MENHVSTHVRGAFRHFLLVSLGLAIVSVVTFVYRDLLLISPTSADMAPLATARTVAQIIGYVVAGGLSLWYLLVLGAAAKAKGSGNLGFGFIFMSMLLRWAGLAAILFVPGMAVVLCIVSLIGLVMVKAPDCKAI